MGATKKKQSRQTVEVAYRVRVVEKMMIRGASYSEIVSAISGKYGVTSRSVDSYIAKAKANITAAFDDVDLKDFAGLTLARLNLVVKRGFDTENLGVVVQAIAQQMKVTGIGNSS